MSEAEGMSEADWDSYAEDMKTWDQAHIDREIEFLEKDLLGDLLDVKSYDRSIEIINKEIARRKNDPDEAYRRAMGVL